jgi:hypothetical protein
MSFDPQAFLDLPIDEAFERRPPVPAMDYPAEINDVVSRPWQSKDKVDARGELKKGIAYDVSLSIQIPMDVKERLGLKPDFVLKTKDSIMLDLNELGGLDTTPGANRQLRNYREALDMNKPGVTFRARDMIGRMLLARIVHEIYPVGSDNVQERVGFVAALT